MEVVAACCDLEVVVVGHAKSVPIVIYAVEILSNMVDVASVVINSLMLIPLVLFVDALPVLVLPGKAPVMLTVTILVLAVGIVDVLHSVVLVLVLTAL